MSQENSQGIPLICWPAAALLAGLALWLAPGASLLRLGAGWFLLCLLPGVVLSLLLDRRADVFEQLAMGAALSPAAVTVLIYLLAGLLHIPLPMSLLITGLVFTGILLFTCLGRGISPISRPTVPGAVVLSAMLLFSGVVAAYYFSRPAALVDPHGLYHTAIIHQMMNGIIPPNNVHLYGAPTAYQWPCYFLPAAVSMLTGASPPVTSAMLRISSFLGIFGMGVLLARQLGLGAAGRAVSGLFAALGMNMLAGLHYLARVLSSPELRYAFFHSRYHVGLISLFSPGLIPEHLQVRTSTLTLKLVNFSFILPGYAAVMTALLGFILVLRGKGRKGYPLVLFGTLGSLLIHPLLAAVIAVPLPLALLLLWLTGLRTKPTIPLGRLLALLAGLAVCGLAALPYLVPEMQTSGGGGVSTGVSYKILNAFLWVYAPLGLLAAFRIFHRSKPLGREEKLLLFLAIFVAAFITVQRLKCEWYMLYLTAVPLGLLAAGAVERWYRRVSKPWLRVGGFLLLTLLVFSGPLLRLHYATLVRLGFENRYRIHGEKMVRLADEESDLARACQWIQENTGPRDLLVEWPQGHSREELAALTGRRVYVGLPSAHSPPGNDPRMKAALKTVGRLYNPAIPDKAAELSQLASLPETVYLVLTRHSLKRLFPSLAEIYAGYPQRMDLVLDLPEARVYRIN